MPDFLHPAVWPVSAELRPKPRRRLVTAADVLPAILAERPNIVAELNCCPAYAWRGRGQPGHGWEDWRHLQIPFEIAVSLPCYGEA